MKRRPFSPLRGANPAATLARSVSERVTIGVLAHVSGWYRVAAAGILALLPSAAIAADTAAAVAPEYSATIQPLLTKYCAGCHNSDDREGKLVLESYADLLRGGKRGAEVVAGHPEQSRLLRVLNGQAELSMPPKDNERPKPAGVALLSAWIEAGAKGPSGAAPDPTALVVPHVEPVGPVRRAINAVACSPDGRWIAVARYGTVELLSAETRAVERTLAPQPGNVNDVAFSADSSMLAVAAGQAGLFGEATLWRVSDGTLMRKFRGHRDSLYAVAVSPDMQILATAGYDSLVKLWNLHTGAELRTLAGHNGPVFALAFDPRGKLLASASGDRTVKLWDVATGERLETFGQPLKDQYTVTFSPDGRHLAAAGADNRIRIWKISETGKEGTNPIELAEFADEQPLVKLIYSPDGQSLVSSADDRRIKFWNAATLAEQRTLERQPDVAPALAFEPGERHGRILPLVVGRMDGSLAFYDPTSGKPIVVAPKSATGIAEQQEIEPNNTPAQANALQTLPATVVGALNAAGDVDYFRFDATAGQTFVFDAAARRIGSKADPRLSLFDADGKLLRERSEFDPESDPLLVYHFDRTGQYLIRIDDRSMAGGRDHSYKLTVGAIPYVVGCYPLSVPAKKATEVELIGYNLPPHSKAKIEAGSPGEATVPIDAKFHTRGPIKVLVGDLPETVPAESAEGVNTNETLERATPIMAPGSAAGRIGAHSAGHVAANYYRFQSKAGQQWIIQTEAASRGSPIDTRIDVLTADGQRIERVVLKAVRDSYINFRGLDSLATEPRLKSYEEMELNQYIYMGGEVCKLFRAPRGPDSDFGLYKALNGWRRAYFDTSATEHANFDPVYVVEPHPPGTKLPNNGLPSFPIYYSNDDDGDRKLGRDSRLLFTAPTDGLYVIRVVDSRDEASERYVFRLTVRTPHPDFRINVVGANPTVNAGSGQQFKVQADRLDYFDGDIRVDIAGIPPGFFVTTPLLIQAGHLEAEGVLCALDGAPQPTPQNAGISEITAIAQIDRHEVTHRIGSLGQIKLGDAPNVVVHLQPAQPAVAAANSKPDPKPQGARPAIEPPPIPEVVLAPGTTTTCKLSIDRRGFTGSLEFDVSDLPHGVIVDNIGLNGILIPAGQNDQTVYLSAAPWVAPIDRLFFAVSKTARDQPRVHGQASLPVWLRIRRPGQSPKPADTVLHR